MIERVGNPQMRPKGKLGLSRNFPKVVAQHLVMECGFVYMAFPGVCGTVLCVENTRRKMTVESDSYL